MNAVYHISLCNAEADADADTDETSAQ